MKTVWPVRVKSSVYSIGFHVTQYETRLLLELVQDHVVLVCHVKLRIQALINILIFTELVILSLTPLHSLVNTAGVQKHHLD